MREMPRGLLLPVLVLMIKYESITLETMTQGIPCSLFFRLVASQQVHASPAWSVVDASILGPCSYRPNPVRVVGREGGSQGLSGSRRGSTGVGEEGDHPHQQVKTEPEQLVLYGRSISRGGRRRSRYAISMR